jgi:hypothetical protein
MTKLSYYSVLRFRPSYLLEEQINVGLLFVFPDENIVRFIYPKNLERVTQFYPDANLKILKKYFKAFEQRAAEMTQALPTVFNDFLLKSAGNLYFGSVVRSEYTNLDKLINDYRTYYFRFYEVQKNQKKDELYLKKVFAEELKHLNFKNKRVLFKRNIIIKNPISTTNFEFAWQNGTTNFVKTISFDLASPRNIQEKAFRWFGELTDFQQYLDNSKIDILVTRPQNKALFGVYDKALRTLQNIKTPHEITEEDGISAYIQNALETVQPFPSQLLKH